uniref:Uncharacterized protein n=1 Tax=Rhizophora mucronata TaxID=61149 RepID=A0A2P2J8U6_RHIMU
MTNWLLIRLLIFIFWFFQHAGHFLYSHPAQPLGPEDLVWRMVC